MVDEVFNNTNWNLRLVSWDVDDDDEPYILEPYQQIEFDVRNIYLAEFNHLILERNRYIQNNSFVFLIKASKLYVYERAAYTAQQPNMVPWIHKGDMFSYTKNCVIHNVGHYNIQLYTDYTYNYTVLRPGEAQLHTGNLSIICNYGHTLLFLTGEIVCVAQKIQYDHHNLYVHS